jgi:putative FmdB family regulatory protein
MPIYEYRCQSCNHELEKLQRLSDPVLTVCPECGKAKLRRLISAAGFRLKGAGWYETDFKQGNKRNLAESSGSNSEGASVKGSSGGDGVAAKTESAGSKSDGAAKPASSSGGSDSSPGATSKKKTGSGGTADPA